MTARRPGVRAAVALLFVAAGCAPEPPAGTPFRIDRRGVRRPAVLERASIAQIGDELRPVPFAREAELVATVEVVTARSGRSSRAAVTLPAATVDDGRLQLYWGLRGGGTYAPLPGPSRLHLHPRRPGRGKIVFPSPVGDAQGAIALRLERMPAIPGRLESEPFDLPPGAVIELGYGVPAHASGPESSTRFTAEVDCAWALATPLVDARVGREAQAEGRWYDLAVPHAEGGRDCRLILTAARDGWTESSGLWSTPRLRVPPTGADAPPDLNVVLVSLDTLRADHVSGYGYVRRTTPNVDEVIERGTMFADVTTTFPMTNVAHLGVFTGRWGAGLPSRGTLPAAVPIRMLTELLRDAGFATAGVTEDGLVSQAYGFAWGFDRLVERYHAPVEGAERVFAVGRRMLEELRDRRFFLFLHTYKVHAPYDPAPPFREYFPTVPDNAVHRFVPEEQRADFDDYDRCIREADAHLGEFLQSLDALGLSERTMVVLLSDHGEGFGEHRAIGHGFSPYQEALRVPLVFRGPGIAADHRVHTPVSLVDVMPTVLDLLGLPLPPEVAGRSLRDPLEGRDLPPRPVFFEWIGSGNVGMRIGSLKIVQTGSSHRTYQLGRDPHERIWQPGAAPEYVEAIARYVDDGAVLRQALDGHGGPTKVSPDVHEALRALGYVE